MREKFYIFLDIDGVLFDWNWAMNEIRQGRMHRGGIIRHLNPDSVSALNYLIQSLDAEYDCRLVISSSWRHDMNSTIEVLYDNGLMYNKHIDKTSFDINRDRKNEIQAYLEEKGKSENFVVIDDNIGVCNAYSQENVIQTNVQNSALSMEKVIDYLERANNYFKEELEN